MQLHVGSTMRRKVMGAAAVALVLPVAACAGGGTGGGSAAPGQGSDASKVAQVSKASVAANVDDGASAVAVDKLVKIDASDGTLSDVSVATLKGDPVAGSMNADKTAWTASDRLDSGRKYQITATAADDKGLDKKFSSRFDTEKLTLDQQVYPEMTPLQGQTVGVGMPISISFDYPVTNKKAFEKHMKVTSSAGQQGAFHWIDDQHVRYRPQSYWKPNQKVTVAINVNSLPAGDGRYGQKNRKLSFDIGRSMVSKVNAKTDQMQVFRGGKLIKTLPITTGKAGFTTRSGTKVITEKYASKRMNSETIGIDPNSSNGYDLDDVKWAMRITNSGEFLHAAPWSVGSQGNSNVSHGCTGMSTENAKWLYDNSIVGDPVEYTGTDRQMTLDNGYGDWNESWSEWKAGSALSS